MEKSSYLNSGSSPSESNSNSVLEAAGRGFGWSGYFKGNVHVFGHSRFVTADGF